MNDLKKLIGSGNIVERYQGVYGLHSRLRTQSVFLEDKVVWLDERYSTDLLERMTEEAERTESLEIVEEYKYSRGIYQDNSQADCRKLIASSSSELEVLDRHDSSMECEKVASQKGYDTDNRSERSDFSRKESVQEAPVAVETVGGNPTAMEVEEEPQQPVLRVEAERLATPPKNRPERYPARASARKETRERTERIAQLKSVGCNCKKSHCLKMYCECFHLQVFCGDNCSCKGCGNMEKTHEQQQAIIEALSRNPRAFDDDNPEKGCFDLGVDLEDVKKGCKCKKTKCLKKYCECFNSGVPCNVFCKCDGCENLE